MISNTFFRLCFSLSFSGRGSLSPCISSPSKRLSPTPTFSNASTSSR